MPNVCIVTHLRRRVLPRPGLGGLHRLTGPSGCPLPPQQDSVHPPLPEVPLPYLWADRPPPAGTQDPPHHWPAATTGCLHEGQPGEKAGLNVGGSCGAMNPRPGSGGSNPEAAELETSGPWAGQGAAEDSRTPSSESRGHGRDAGARGASGRGGHTGTRGSAAQAAERSRRGWGAWPRGQQRPCSRDLKQATERVSFLINLLHNNIIIIIINNNIRNIDLCGVYHNVRVRRPQDENRGESPQMELRTKGGVKRG